MSKDKAMQMALDALEEARDAIAGWGSYADQYFQEKHNLEGDIDDCEAVIEALRAALAKPEQDLRRKRRLEKVQDAICANLMAVNSNSVEFQPIKTQPEPEPVAWFDKKLNGIKWKDNILNSDLYDRQPLYLAPPQRKPDSITWDVSANNGRVRFTIGVQSFALDYYPENQDGQLDKKQQEWMCKQLHHALSRLETNLSQSKPDTTCERCGKKLGTEVTDIHTCTPKENQPVAWCIIENDRVHGLVKSKPAVINSEKWQPLYTAPQKKEWVGLTDEEICDVLVNLQEMYIRPPTKDSRVIFAYAIEAKLKEKNT